MALNREQIRVPCLPKEAVDVPELGGEIIVSGLPLSKRLELYAGQTRGDWLNVSRLLESCVLDPDGVPLMTVAEWEAFGAQHFEAALRLVQVSQRLSGMNAEDAGKNSQSGQS